MGVIIGITGQSGAGKSTVGGMLRARGFHVIDADEVSRIVTRRGEPCLLDLAIEFGTGVLNRDGELNRKKLGKIVFGDREKLARLNEITHPYILGEIMRISEGRFKKGERAVFLDAPTLFESGGDKLCDKVIAVVAPREKRFNRIKERDGLSDADANARLDAQHESEYYASRSNILIENGSDVSALRVLVMEMLDKLGLALGRLGKSGGEND